MSIQSEIDRIKAAVASAYEAAKSKGAVAPELEDVANLASTILTITGGGGDIPLGNKLYTFGVLSDIHLKANNLYNGIDDFNRAIPCIQNLGAEFVGISGDIGYDNVVGELELYRTALDTHATVPFHCVRGNHDVKQTEENWITYTGFASNHEFVYNGDVFLFLSRDISTDSSNTQATPYSEGLTWIKERLERYKGARIFIFCHYPPSGYSGLADGQYYGWYSASTEDDELVTAINQTKNVVMFTGHTHYKFQVEDTYDNINIYRFNASRTALVHVPSCAYPRNASSGVESDLSQGYLVEVYEQGVVLRGVDLVTGELMPEYEYALTMDNNKAAAENAIILSNRDITLGVGLSTQEEVTLASPADLTVYVSANNSNITVNPTSLVFTEENYNTSQLVTITAAESVGNNATALVTLRAENLASKTISVTLMEIGILCDKEYMTATMAGTDELQVSLSSPSDVSVSVASENGYASANPNTLSFTSENYADAQTISVSGAVGDRFLTDRLFLSAEGFKEKKIPILILSSTAEEATLASGANTIADNVIYTGTHTGAYFSQGNDGDYTFAFIDFNLTANNTIFQAKATTANVEIYLAGNNSLTSTATSGGRGLSFSSTIPIKLIGIDGATLVVKGVSASHSALKGDYEMTNVDMSVTSNLMPLTVVNSGMTIVGNGSFSVNTAKVVVMACEHGSLSVNVGAGTPGSSAITITSIPDSGYTLESILVNGVASTDSLTMPAEGETLTIQGVFAET